MDRLSRQLNKLFITEETKGNVPLGRNRRVAEGKEPLPRCLDIIREKRTVVRRTIPGQMLVPGREVVLVRQLSDIGDDGDVVR